MPTNAYIYKNRPNPIFRQGNNVAKLKSSDPIENRRKRFLYQRDSRSRSPIDRHRKHSRKPMNSQKFNRPKDRYQEERSARKFDKFGNRIVKKDDQMDLRERIGYGKNSVRPWISGPVVVKGLIQTKI